MMKIRHEAEEIRALRVQDKEVVRAIEVQVDAERQADIEAIIEEATGQAPQGINGEGRSGGA
jgi:hypothetical protein